MRKAVFLFIGLFSLASLLTHCKKYEEGPAISFRTKEERLVNNWDVKVALEDDRDVTYWFRNWTIDITEDGRFVTTDLDEQDSTVTASGFWWLANEKQDLLLVYSDPPVDPDRFTYQITKLKEEELWFTRTTDSSHWEFRLIPVGTAEEE